LVGSGQHVKTKAATSLPIERTAIAVAITALAGTGGDTNE
jgi:hypothetical protein